MAFNPSRSWSLTYNQMWNLSMRDPLPKNTANAQSGGSKVWINEQSNSPNRIQIKPDYCWNFNKGIKCNYGKKCKFIERCSYRDSTNDGVYSCHKLQKKQQSGGFYKRRNHGGGHNQHRGSGGSSKDKAGSSDSQK